ncbi:MAG: PKD domain-containing protein [Planctomycetota bacterium]
MTKGLGVLVLCVSTTLTGSLWGQFGSPLLVSPDTAGNDQPHMTLDPVDNVLVVFQRQGDVFFASSLGLFQSAFNLSNNPEASSHPRIVSAIPGNAQVVFEQPGGLPGAVGSDILTVNNNGGVFGSPLNLTLTADAEAGVDVTQGGPSPDFTWESIPASGPSQITLRRGFTAPVNVGEGTAPATAAIGSTTYVGYTRGTDILYRTYNGTVLGPESTLASLMGFPTFLDLAASGSVVHAVFVFGGDLYYTNNQAGTFQPAQVIDSGVTGRPSVSSNAVGVVAVAYEKSGQIWFNQGPNGMFLGAVVATPGTTSASQPVVAVDSTSFSWLTYVDAGGVYLRNNVPPPAPDFTATPTTGEINLTVQFTNTTVGVVDSYFWHFGDGTSSTATNPSHTYAMAGNYTVTLTATGPGGTTVETKTNFVQALAPTNIFEMPAITVFGAQQDVLHPILVTSTNDIAGFQIVVEFDNAVTTFNEATLANTFIDPLDPEFIFMGSDTPPPGPGSRFYVALIIDFEVPIEGRVLPAGQRMPLLFMKYDVPIGISVGTTRPLTFRDDLYPVGNPLDNIISIDGGFSVNPFLSHGSVTVAAPGVTFLRGDSNRNSAVDLADAIFTLAFLFSGGAPPTCPDSSDVNDDGQINVADAISLLSYLFSGGQIPRYPFPGVGLDPTADVLGPCI